MSGSADEPFVELPVGKQTAIARRGLTTTVSMIEAGRSLSTPSPAGLNLSATLAPLAAHSLGALRDPGSVPGSVLLSLSSHRTSSFPELRESRHETYAPWQSE